MLSWPNHDVRRERMVAEWVNPAIDELMDIERRDWTVRDRKIKGPKAGLGFTGVVQPNIEPVVAPAAVTGGTVEVNLYTPGTGTNASWALLPVGTIRAAQTFHVRASGVFTTSLASQTLLFTSRIGTSGTPATNVSVGATGALLPSGSAGITAGLWDYSAVLVVRSVGTAGTMLCTSRINLSTTAPPITGTVTGMAGNLVGTVDTTIQQGFVLSMTPSAAAVSAQILQFVIVAFD